MLYSRYLLFVCFIYISEYPLIPNSYFIPPPSIHFKHAQVQNISFLSKQVWKWTQGRKKTKPLLLLRGLFSY